MVGGRGHSSMQWDMRQSPGVLSKWHSNRTPPPNEMPGLEIGYFFNDLANEF